MDILQINRSASRINDDFFLSYVNVLWRKNGDACHHLRMKRVERATIYPNFCY